MFLDFSTLQELVAAAIAGFSILGGVMVAATGLVGAVGLVDRREDAWLARYINLAIGAGFLAGLPAALGAAMIEVLS